MSDKKDLEVMREILKNSISRNSLDKNSKLAEILSFIFSQLEKQYPDRENPTWDVFIGTFLKERVEFT